MLLLRELAWWCLLRARSCCGLEMLGKGTVLLPLLLRRRPRKLMRLKRDTISLLWELARLWLLGSRHGLGGLREHAILLLLLWELSLLWLLRSRHGLGRLRSGAVLVLRELCRL